MSTKSHKRFDRNGLVSFNESMAKDVCKEFVNAVVNECVRRFLTATLGQTPPASSAANPPSHARRKRRAAAVIG